MNILTSRRKTVFTCIIQCMLLFLAYMPLSAQNGEVRKVIHGVVTDAQGEPLIGAIITSKDDKALGTATDFDGKFTLTVPEKSTLRVSYMGYQPAEIIVGKNDNYNLSLKEDISVLDEVVVVGYGSMKKSDIISSVTSVKADDMKKAVTLDVGEMLRGKAAGVQINTSYAGPGGGSDIKVRGVTSLGTSQSPTIIADGVTIGSINDINPNDIESIEILKDAAAQAIYGARAANGVVLITTKRGVTGKTTVNYNGYYGTQDVKRNFDVYTPEEFVQYKREAYRTTNGGVYGADDRVFSKLELESITNNEYIDWQKALMRTGSIQKHDVSIMAGTDKTKVFASVSYEDQEGVVKMTNFRKGQFRINVDQEIASWLKAGFNTNWGISEANDPGMKNILIDAVTCSPLGQIYDEDGNLSHHPTGLQENWNPLATLYERTSLKKNRYDLINIFFDAKVIDGLTYRLNTSRRSWNQKQEDYNSSKSRAGSYTGKGSGSITNRENYEWAVENIFSYDKSFGKHNLSGIFVQSWNEKKETANGIAAELIPDDLLGIYGFGSAEKVTPSLSGYKRRLISSVLRIQYNYDSRYYLSVSGRRDGSSVFGRNNKWATFPAVAAGWNIYMEPFLANSESLSNLKLRVSYGSVGNEAIAPYGSIAGADQWDYMTTGRLSGYMPGAVLSNPNLKWETSTTLNLALDFGFFRNRLSGTVELYQTKTTDQLVNRTITSSSGYTNRWDNMGEVQNKGIELQLNGVIIDNRDFRLEAGMTFSKINNKITKLFGDRDGDGKEDDYPAQNWFIGKPVSVERVYEYGGIWQESEKADIPNSAQPTANPGDIKLVDRDGDGKLTVEDQIIISKLPKWNASFNLKAEYKNFDFSADIYTVQGIKKKNPFLWEYTYGGNMRGVFNGIKVNYWTPENPTGNFPRPTTLGANEMQSIAFQDASYIRLQNLTIGYTLPKAILTKLKVERLRVYFSGQNLWTKTDYQSYGPEQAADAYPEAKTISGGIQLSF